MKRKKLKNMFEPKTRDGTTFKIMGNYTETLGLGFRVAYVVLDDELGWSLKSCSENGMQGTRNNVYDLIPVKPEKRVIDYTALPKDVLCVICGHHKRYSNGLGDFIKNGCDSFTQYEGRIIATRIKIIVNPTRPARGNILNEIPDNVRVKVTHKDGVEVTDYIQDIQSKDTVIYYQILREEE